MNYVEDIVYRYNPPKTQMIGRVWRIRETFWGDNYKVYRPGARGSIATFAYYRDAENFVETKMNENDVIG